MRKNYLFTIWLASFVITNAYSQAGKQYTGSWAGKLNVGVEISIIFHITEENNKLVTLMDSPDQSAFDIATDETTLTAEGILISLKKMNVSFSGRLVNDSTIDGVFRQGTPLPLILKKITKTIEKKVKPQTPVPPFPYTSQDVVYKNKAGTADLAATLTIPAGRGPFPAVVLVSGSGAQNRNADMLGHSFFAVLADHLTRHGIAVLRYDERGVGKSGGNFASATTRDFADDAEAGINYLLTRKETDKAKVGIIGHSEGGLVAPMVASQRSDIDFIIMLAGPGIQTLEMMAEQNEAIVKTSGASDEAAGAFRQLYREVVTALLSQPDSLQKTIAFLEGWAAGKDGKMLEALNLATTEKRQGYVSAMGKQLQSGWLKYFMALNPADYLEKLTCKALALNGGKGIQVLAASNLAGIRESLEKSKSPAYEVKEIPGLNHLFQACNKCSLDEYGSLDETFSPAALQLITDWLTKYVK